MGLDRWVETWFTRTVKLLAVGLGNILRAVGLGKKVRVAPFERERRTFEEEVRRELLKLKEKGIDLPVFTL